MSYREIPLIELEKIKPILGEKRANPIATIDVPIDEYVPQNIADLTLLAKLSYFKTNEEVRQAAIKIPNKSDKEVFGMFDKGILNIQDLSDHFGLGDVESYRKPEHKTLSDKQKAKLLAEDLEEIETMLAEQY